MPIIYDPIPPYGPIQNKPIIPVVPGPLGYKLKTLYIVDPELYAYLGTHPATVVHAVIRPNAQSWELMQPKVLSSLRNPTGLTGQHVDIANIQLGIRERKVLVLPGSYTKAIIRKSGLPYQT